MRQLLLATLICTLPLSAVNIVVNPGFETGLVSWTLSGGAGSTWTAGAGAHTGSGAVSDGCSGSACITTPTSALFQDLTTVIGTTYIVSFWASSGTSSTPDELQALLGGTLVKDLINFANGYTQYTSSTFTAVSTTTRLQFNGRDDPAFLQLDDVCVDANGGACGTVSGGAVPEPGTWFLSGAGVLVVVAIRRLTA
jgi:hypothetical protein